MNQPKPIPPAGLYVHWPFCERKCPYCDFYSVGRGEPGFEWMGRYGAALRREIASAPDRLGLARRAPVDSIYFGGGTPSLMGADAGGALLGLMRETFAPAAETEITLETNPTTAETAGLPELLDAGVNRLSVGVQSFNDRILAALGRPHEAATTRRTLARMRELGVTNLSLDLIFGAPGQSLADVEADLETALSYKPEHVSVYGLTVHEGTPFSERQRAGRLQLPGDELQAAMFEHLIDRLTAAGFEHYEISNFARPGRASRHNAKYWCRCDVYGFGSAAHSVVDERRLVNPPDLERYIEVGEDAWARPEPPPASDRARGGEIMMLALRRVAGVSRAELVDWLGADPLEVYGREIGELSGAELLEVDGQRLRLTRSGILRGDMVMEYFF